MTTFNLDGNNALYQIKAFKPGLIQVNNKLFTHSIIITPTHLIENWSPQRIEDLTQADLQVIFPLKPNILLIGTGSTHTLLPAKLYGNLINHGIGVEIMDTSAACRTYNALSAENRNVAAALIIQ